MRRLAPLIALALAGCGSTAAAELPAPAGPPASPALTERPAGRVEALTSSPPAERSGDEPAGRGSGEYSLDRSGDRLLAPDGRSAPTCREPIALSPLDRGARVAVLCGRERVLDIYDASTLERRGRAGAGIGPTGVATDGVELLYVIDALGKALLVYHLRPFELIRRVHLGAAPYAIAYDRARWGMWIALTDSNQLVNYSAGNRPVIRDMLPSIRDVRALSVDGDVLTAVGQGERQVLRLRSR